MNGAQLLKAHGGSSGLMSGTPASAGAVGPDMDAAESARVLAPEVWPAERKAYLRG
jgi:hypothetical protein